MAQLIDNYAYVLVDMTGEAPYKAVAIDCSDSAALIDALDIIATHDYGSSKALRLEAILSTHKHWDHSAGNENMLKLVPECTKVYGGKADNVPACTDPLEDGEEIPVGTMTIRAIATPCHTRGSMCYLVSGVRRQALFTGDTLFCGGCGAPFEGSQSLMETCFQKLWVETCAKPDDALQTMLFPGHEYSDALIPEYFRHGGPMHLPTSANGKPNRATRRAARVLMLLSAPRQATSG